MRATFSQLAHVIMLCAPVLLGTPAFATNETPQTFTLDGQLFSTGTSTPLLDSAADIDVQILDPNKNCILYEEHQTVDTTATNGLFTIQVGSATSGPTAAKRTGADPGNNMTTVFQNKGSIAAAAVPSHTCAGSTYAPAAGDQRYFRLTVTPSSGVGETLTPDLALDSVPNALVAQSIQGIDSSSLLKANTTAPATLTQATLETIFNSTRLPALQALADGTSSQYVATSAATGVEIPTYSTAAPPTAPAEGSVWFDSTSHQLKFYANGSTQIVGTSSATGTVTSITAGTGLTGGTITTSGTIAVDVGTTAGQIVQVQTGGKLPALDGSNLTGLNGSAITSGTIGGSTAISTSGNIQTSQDVTARRYVLFDHAGVGPNSVALQAPTSVGTSYSLVFPSAQGGAGQSLVNDGSGNLSWQAAGAGTVTSVTSANSDISVASTTTAPVLTLNSGTGANQIVKLDASAKLPAVDGSALTNLNAGALTSGTIAAARMPALTGDVTMTAGTTATTLSKIQTVPLTITTLTSGNFLKYNGTAWVNIAPSSADLSDGSSLIKSSQMPANCSAGQTLTFSSPTGTWTCSNITVTASNFGTQTANTVFAGPSSGGAATPSFRALAAADLPSISSGLTGILPVANGGTGTSTGSITGTGALTFAAGGTNQNVTLTPSGTGYTLLNGNVGIGTTSPSYPLHVVAPVSTVTGGNAVGADSDFNVQPASSSSATYQAMVGNAYVNSGSSAITGSVNGYSGWAENDAAATVTNMKGGYAGVQVNNSSGTITNASGGQFQVLGTSGSIGTAYGVQGVVATATGGSITTAYGVYADVTKPAGTLTNGYGVYINNVQGTNRWGLYDNSGANSYFSGKVGVGTTTPSALLQLKAGTATAGTAPLKLTAGTNLTTPEDGAMEYDGSSYYLTVGATRYPIQLGGGPSSFTTIGAGAGSAAAPSLSFSGDSDTGFYDASSNNTISVAAGGVKIFDFSSAGLVSPTTGGANITTANGTATAPTYSFAGDTGTGWYRPAAGNLAAATSGAERVRINSTGVAIGTTVVAGLLDVDFPAAAAGTSGQPIILNGQWGGTGNTNGGNIYLAPGRASGTGQSGNVQVALGGTQDALMVVNDNGNYARSIGLYVGNESNSGSAITAAIGNGSTNTVTDSLVLQRQTDSNTAAAGLGTGVLFQTVNTSGTFQSSGEIATVLTTAGANNTADMTFSTQAAGTLSEKMRLTSAGKLGIGTTNPGQKLSVTGSITVDSSAANTGTISNALIFGGDGDGEAIGSKRTAGGNAYGLDFYTSSQNRMVISNGGNVGIGTTTPTAKLHLLAGTATAGTAPLKFTAGTNLTTPEPGAIEFDGTNLYYTDSTSARKQLSTGAGGGALSAITAATATNTIDNLNFAQTWNWSTATTQTPLAISANALTTGSLLSLTTSNGTLNSTSGLLNVANTSTSTSGMVARIQSNSTAGSGLTVLANGNVGVGVTNPSTTFSVFGGTTMRKDMSSAYASSGATAVPSNAAQATLSNQTGADGSATFLQSALVNGSSLLQYGYQGFVSVTGAGNYSPAYVIGRSTGSASYAESFRIDSSGNVGVGTNAPTAKLHLPAGTATAGTAPLKLTAGTNLTTPEPGAIEFDGTNLYYTDATSARKQITTGAGSSSQWTTTGSDIYYSTGKVGIGTNAPASPLHVTTSFTGTSGTANGTQTALSYAPSGTSSATVNGANTSLSISGSVAINAAPVASYNSVNNTSSSTTSGITGTYNSVMQNHASGTTASLIGTYNDTVNLNGTATAIHGDHNYVRNANAGSIGTAVGSWNEIRNVSTGSTTNAIGSNSYIYTSGTGSITNAYGFYATAPATSTAGTIGTYYGLYIQNPTAANTNYSIYSAGGTNYFGGSVGVGTTTPNASLEVNGSAQVKQYTANTATSGSVTSLSILPSYNQGSGTAANTDLLINRTQTAVGSGQQNLIDAQVGGVSKFRVDNTGKIFGDGSGLTNVSGAISGLTTGQIPKAGSGTTIVDSIITESGGNIGIGTTSPNTGTRLDVRGGAIASGAQGTAAGQGGEHRFYELTANGSEYVGFRAPDSIATAKIWTLPGADGTSGQFLQTDGAGTLSWGSATGGLPAANGTASSPTINFANSTGTGLFRAGVSIMGFSTAGNEVMRIDASGNVAIGTTSTTAKLRLPAGTATAGTAPLKLTAGTNLTTPEPGAIEFDGTNLYYTDSTSARKQLSTGAGGAALSAITAATATNTINNANFAQTWNWSTATTQTPLAISANALTTGSLLSLTTSNGTVNSTSGLLNVANTGASTNGMVARVQSNSTAGSGLTVLANGSVGIGTSAPTANLQVTGSLTQTGGDFYLEDASGTASVFSAFNAIYVDSYNIFLRDNNGTNNILIQPGAMGIGTTALQAALEVQAATSAGSGAAYGVRFKQTLTAAANNDALTALYINPTFADAAKTGVAHNGLIVTSGNVGIGTTTPGQMLEVAGNVKAVSFISTSDRRLKENITPSEGLSSILKLRGVQYDWIKTGAHDHGLIAQEVETVFPDVVVTDPNSGYKAVKYQNLISPLVEATKELHGMCVSTETKTRELAQAVDDLKVENAKLKADLKSLQDTQREILDQLRELKNSKGK